MKLSSCSTCYDQDLDSLIYGIKFTLNKLAVNVSNSILNGYSCDKSAWDKVNTLQNYLWVLEDENQSISLGGEPCLDEHKLQQLAERVRKMTTDCDVEGRDDLIVDHTNLDAWVAANPYCVSREKWEKIAYTVCKAFKLEITNIEDKCNLTFEVVRNIIPCDIIIAISVFEQMCNLKLKVGRDEAQCKIDFDILANETNCNIDFRTYKSLIECNLSFDILKTIYENQCTVEVNNGVVVLVTPLNTYPLNELKFTGIPDLNVLKTLNVNTSKSKYLKNPQAFINKLKQDYKNGK